MSAPITTELHVTGMTCNNCARKVTEAAQRVSGVHSVAVSVATQRATVRWHSEADRNLSEVMAAITRAGYDVKETAAAGSSKQSRWQWTLILGLTVTAGLMIGEWGFRLGMTAWFQWLAFALAGSVQLFCGAEFYRGAWRQLKVGASNMDTLVALGSTTAFGYSAWALLTGAGGHVYFMEAAAIISLISFGHWLEARVSDRASGALKSLLNLAPQTARKLLPHNEPEEGRTHTSPRPSPHLAPPPLPNAEREKHSPPSDNTSLPGLRDQSAHGDSGKSHPGPLPPGAGTAPMPLRKPMASGFVPALERILPLPAGEGRGEGSLNLKSLSFSQSEIRNPKSEIETEVPVSSLKIGDRIALRPGDRMPVDGVVLEGESAVDEAMLTGESIPADKKSGSELFAGTVNLNGRLVLRVTATGESTALAHVIAAVQRAQTSRANIQRLGDRISNVFVPVVVNIALLAGLWWGLVPASANHAHDWLAQFLWHAHLPAGAAAGFIIAAAVLIIACPCAMGLATPAAIMAGANAAAKRGILIRDGVALEKAGEVTAVIFDKTGTLTMGKPEVAGSISFLPHPNPLPLGEGTVTTTPRKPDAFDPNPAREQLLPLPAGEGRGEGERIANLAAALARHSTHPISQAIASLSSEPVDLTDWQEIRGCGLAGKRSTSNHPPSTVRLGSLRWLRELGVNLTGGEKFITEWSTQGATIVGLATETELLGLFAVRDTLKPHSASVVEQLQQQGLKVFLLTGDNAQTAAAIAKEVGIAAEYIFAEVRPEQKADFVKQLQARGERVAFVGDGINDAPALTQADLGIAVSRASDIAREAADIILLKSEIEAVPEALGLARATLRTIKQNLFWAFFYNALGVPLAALGFISPVFCAAAMGVSDLIVIGNALRLLRWRR